MSRRNAALVAALVLSGGLLAACGSDATPSNNTSSAGATTATASPTETSAPLVLVDVRTPQEFAAGHVQGAVNIPLQDPELAARVTQLVNANPGAQLAVYCRSGNRSAQATQILQNAGLTVTDLGSVEQALAETGLPLTPPA